MTKMDLLQKIMENHNRIAQIEVHGEGAILVADTLRDLRNIFRYLQNEDLEEENLA